MSICAGLFDCQDGANTTSFMCLGEEMFFNLPVWIAGMVGFPWIGATIGSVLVGLSGVLPLLVIPIDETQNLKQGG